MILGADGAHRLGATGKGVRVAMVDSGLYLHPFYNWHDYSVNSVVLGPGASDPENDMVGHGTGQAANIFAVAPAATLVPVKAFNSSNDWGSDPAGSFNTAIAQKPDVISGSWGWNVDTMTWSQFQTAEPDMYNYMKTLEAAVAHAVALGIVVCFSAGNGEYQFPASHPDVISVGGVHPNCPFRSWDDLEASDGASSFDSSLYRDPERHVPDLCGLSGRRAANGDTPLIMLPVQTGSMFDHYDTSPRVHGWGIFAGTSATCPQVAGVVALMLEKRPDLSPAQVKKILTESCVDVRKGRSAMGDCAGPGWDRATGAGLVNAARAWLNTIADLAADFREVQLER
jgi:subtilisin family serine protease